MLSPAAVEICRADYQDLQGQAETVASVWVGGYFNDTGRSTNTSFADTYSPALVDTTSRQGTLKASEFYSLDSSASGGMLLKGAPLPNRYHLEFDYYNDNDWFGDLRYSFRDNLLIRILPRRFFHNLDNVRVYDFAPAVGGAFGNDVEVTDAVVDDYGLRIDIDEYRVRLKTPNFPLHVYSDGEIVRRKGKQQLLFMGGNAYFSDGRGRVRVSEAREIDQEKQEVAIGTNAHLGPIEVDFAHRNRKFDSDADAPIYAYDFGISTHNVTPELKAETNTVKVHTSHTGRLFASATYSEISKTNETSQAEAENAMGYGEVVWLPAAYLAFTAKYRNQKNEATAPATVDALGQIAPGVYGIRTYTVHPGVESTTDTGSLRMRYSLIPSSNLSVQYTRQIKKVEDESAMNWARPPEQSRNIYELGFTNWAIPKVRISGKYRRTRIKTEFGNEALIEPVNNDPNKIDMGNLGLTWLISPRVTLFVNANVTKEDTTANRQFSGVTDAETADALHENYLASLSFAISENFIITPTYTYMSFSQDRELVWTNTVPETVVDSDYTNKQKAQNFALNFMLLATKRLTFNGAIDYTKTDGTYEPTSLIAIPFAFNAAEIAQFSATETNEFNVRLDSAVDLGRGWGLGLDLRYTDWRDDSFDNPSDGTFAGGLVKVTKLFHSQ
jgi:hypothetical protein